MDRRARVRPFISSASSGPGLCSTLNISTFPFRERRPSIQSMLGSQIASCISPIGPFVPHIRAGTLRALATTGAQRSPLLPDVPTIAEAGYPALEIHRMVRHFCCGGDARGTVDTLSSVLRTTLQTKEVQAGLANKSVDAAGHTPADFARQVKADFDRWGPIVKAVRVHPPMDIVADAHIFISRTCASESRIRDDCRNLRPHFEQRAAARPGQLTLLSFRRKGLERPLLRAYLEDRPDSCRLLESQGIRPPTA